MILGVDPGTRKCGYALLAPDTPEPVVLGIAPLAELRAVVESIAAAYPIEIVALGRGTNSDHVASILTSVGLPHALVDETETTLRARARFFRDHPPRGWKRFVPRGMLLPDRPIDDYAALLIAQRYLATPATHSASGRSR
jgi:RNase H-fold protein (predicted Holliday junction resolvase)